MNLTTASILGLLVTITLALGTSTIFLFVKGEISGGVSCSSQGNGKTYCCASVSEGTNYGQFTTYCTTCDDTNPPSNCTPREKPRAIVNPGRDLSDILQGGVQGKVATSEPSPSLGGLLGLANENNLTFSQANITSDSGSNNDFVQTDNTTQTMQSNSDLEEQATDSIKQKKTVDKGEDAEQEHVDEDVPNNLKIPD